MKTEIRLRGMFARQFPQLLSQPFQVDLVVFVLFQGGAQLFGELTKFLVDVVACLVGVFEHSLATFLRGMANLLDGAFFPLIDLLDQRRPASVVLLFGESVLEAIVIFDDRAQLSAQHFAMFLQVGEAELGAASFAVAHVSLLTAGRAERFAA